MLLAVGWCEYCEGVRVVKMTNLNQWFGAIVRIVLINKTVARKYELYRGESVRENTVGISPSNILGSSLIYMIDYSKRVISGTSETDRMQPWYQLCGGICNWVPLYTQTTEGFIDAHLDSVTYTVSLLTLDIFRPHNRSPHQQYKINVVKAKKNFATSSQLQNLSVAGSHRWVLVPQLLTSC